MPAADTEVTGTEAPRDGAWHFDFHGYLRAPMRLGFGEGEDGDGKLHSPGQLPDGTFTNWRYTGNVPGPWVELRFQYGNDRVTANVSVASYNITDGGYRNLQAQLGIDQAFIKLDFSDLLEDKGGFIANVGVFQNRYGAAGRYDAGKYDTYLIGRTHVAGETLTAFYHLTDLLTLTLEEGFGATLEIFRRNAGFPDPGPDWAPYPGPVQQGTQLVAHGHAMLGIGDQLQIGLHLIHTWTDDARTAMEKDGSITTWGIDAKLIDSQYGDAYLGYSHLNADNPLRLATGLEVLHSIAGWTLRDNFFGQGSTGSGDIDTVLLQYTLSIAKLLLYPEPFWGQSPDIIVSLFGMYNHVTSDDPMFTGASDKFKWGVEATYTPLGWLGIGARFDRVQPDLANSLIAFSQISPRLVFRSEFVTHEQIILQYTHYFYGSMVQPSWPNEPYPADSDVVMISAIMWW